MKDTPFTSPAIAKEMERVYGGSAKVVKIEMRHEEEVNRYMTMIEEARKRASESDVFFG